MTGLAITLLAMGCLMSFFYTASEIAIVTVNRVRLQHLLRTGARKGRHVRDIIARPETYLASSVVGVNVANNLVAVVATYLLRDQPVLTHGAAKYVTFFVGSVLFLFWAELVPKALVRQQPTLFLLRMQVPLVWSYRLFAPFVVGIDQVTHRLLGAAAPTDGAETSRSHLKGLLMSEEVRKLLPGPEGAMADRLLEFHGVTVRDVCCPRCDVIEMQADTPTDAFLAQVRTSGYTRIPVCESDGGAYVGIVNVFDVLYSVTPPSTIRPFVRQAPVVNASDAAWGTLARFQNTPHRIAFVEDNTGRHVGIVTIEDLVEEIMGELR